MQYLAAVSLLAVFIINIAVPPSFVIDILYLCSIVLVFKQNTKTILGFSIAAAVLIIINTIFFDVESRLSMSLWINRLISLFAIFITSYIAIHYRKQTEAGLLKEQQKHQQYIKALESMLFMMSHEVRKPVANILGLIEALCAHRAELSQEETQQLCTHLQSSSTELDTFIRALNTFMEQTEKSTANSDAPTDKIIRGREG